MDIQLKSPKRAALCVSVLGVLALSALVVAAAGRGAPASAESRPAYGGTVVAGLLGQPVSVDPLTADSHAEVTLVSLLFDTLYRLVGSGTAAQLMVEPHVAAALPIVSDDGLEARIPIREEIRFHGGRRLSARFVRRSLKRLAESRSGWLLAPVRTIRVADGAVVLELRRPTPELAALLAAPATAIVPPETPQLTRVIGSGPFRLARVDRRRQRVRLRAAERYFAGRPYIDQLTLRWYTRPEQEATDYEAGRAQMSHRGAVAFSSHRPAFRTGETSSAATMLTYIGFGKSAAHAAITSSSDFRRALSLALDRNSFRGVGSGERVVPALYPVPVDIGGPAVAPAARRSRMNEARASLASAARRVPALGGVRTTGGRVALEVLIDRTRLDDREIAEKVAAALFRLGVAARVTTVDADDFAARTRDGSCDLYIGQLVAPIPAPAPILAAAFAAGRDDWARATLAVSGLDLEAGARAFARRLPVVPLFHRAVRVHHRSDLRGVEVDSAARVTLADLYYFGKAERNR